MINFGSRTYIAIFLFQFLPLLAIGQLLQVKDTFSRYDSLMGSISPLRDYDVTHYKISLDINIGNQSLDGEVDMEFFTQDKMKQMQLDLFNNYEVKLLTINGKPCKYSRDKNHLFVETQNIITTSDIYNLKIKYSGTPPKAKKAPWDGGFVWSKDSLKRDWIGVACEGLGASSWWACKDHWSDEPDRGVEMIVRVPKHLIAVSNGKLIYQTVLKDGRTEWKWKVNNPINLYDITLNIAHYQAIRTTYTSKENNQTLNITYWVLDYNVDRAKKQFEQVKPMLDCYEAKLGAYPFYEDGYQLVETPYLGMEHQSCVAYGNQYKMGYLGNTKMTGGHDFDYIIIHETGHEWFGNNITAADNADMWIHEALTTYSESIYAECIYGNGAGDAYMNKMKPRVRNLKPIQGVYGVAKEGDGDMYAKGALFFHTLRYQINNDLLWGNLIKKMSKEFGKKTVNYQDILGYFNRETRRTWDDLFSTYLQYAPIPELKLDTTTDKGVKTIKLSLTHPIPSLTMLFFYKVDGKEYSIKVEKNKTQELRISATAQFEINQDKGYYKLVK